MTKVIMNGCNGHMGHVISDLCEKMLRLRSWQALTSTRSSITVIRYLQVLVTVI